MLLFLIEPKIQIVIKTLLPRNKTKKHPIQQKILLNRFCSKRQTLNRQEQTIQTQIYVSE
jgi:hypothetical protein